MATSSRHLPNDETFPTSTAPVGQRSTRRLPRNPPPQGARLKERYMPLQQSSPFQADLRTIQQTTDQMLTQLEDIKHRLSGSTPCQPGPEARQQPLAHMKPTPIPRRISASVDYPLLTPQSQRKLHYQPQTSPSQHRLLPSHQVKSVPVFTGRDQASSIAIDDWVRDLKYLIDTTSMPVDMQFSTIVRYLGGTARKLVLNLPPKQQTPSHAFTELKAQFGDTVLAGDPLANFYERMQIPNEPPSIYAVELEATLRTIEERSSQGRPFPNRNSMLTQQFMRGVKDEKVTQRLAPMRPRDMTFRELQVELRQLEREARMAAALKTGAKIQSQQSQQLRSQYEQQRTSYTPDPTANVQSQPVKKDHNLKTDHDVLQDLVLTVRQLAEKVERMAAGPREVQRPKRDQQPDGQRVFICHKCGQEGHIARGCRRVPLNPEGPRQQGEPAEAQKPQAR